MASEAGPTGSSTPGHRRVQRRLWVVAGVLGLALALRTHYRLVLSVGESMQPTLGRRALLLVDTRAYTRSNPGRGDIVVAQHRHSLITKRVVGLPGEEVELRHGRLYVNGAAVEEVHAGEPGLLDIGRGHLLEGRYAVLGDNRSLDLNEMVFAVVPQEQILGKVIASLSFPWPY